MKTIISAIILCVIFGGLAFGQSSYHKFYSDHKDMQGVESFEMSSSLLHFLLKKEDKTTANALKRVGKVTFFVADSASPEMMDELRYSLPGNVYKDVMQIRDGKSTVCFKVRESERDIEEVLMTVTDTNSLVVMCISGSFSHNEVNNLIHSIDVDNTRNTYQ